MWGRLAAYIGACGGLCGIASAEQLSVSEITPAPGLELVLFAGVMVRVASGLPSKLWRLYRRLGLHHLTRTLMPYAPAGVRRAVDKMKTELGIRNRRRLTPERELTQFYRTGLGYLVDKHGAEGLGDYLEFGVYNGTSLISMHRALAEAGLDHVRLFGFDSFEGLPPDEEGYWGPGGRFKSEYEFTRQILIREGIAMDQVTLVKGFFSDTLNQPLVQEHQLRKASVIMIDVDMYRSAKEALEFCAPMIVDEALVVFDDWHPLAAQNLGEKRAFDEFLQDHPQFRAQDYGSTYIPDAQSFLVTRVQADAVADRQG
jgi:O-methyltransferase